MEYLLMSEGKWLKKFSNVQQLTNPQGKTHKVQPVSKQNHKAVYQNFFFFLSYLNQLICLWRNSYIDLIQLWIIYLLLFNHYQSCFSHELRGIIAGEVRKSRPQKQIKLGGMVNSCNPITREGEAGSSQIQGQPELIRIGLCSSVAECLVSMCEALGSTSSYQQLGRRQT